MMGFNFLISFIFIAESLAFFQHAPVRVNSILKSGNDDEPPSETELLEKAFSKGYKDDLIAHSTEQFLMDNERVESVDIPKEGISVSEVLEAANRDRFSSVVVPIKTLPGVAQIVTKTKEKGSFDPIRYIVALKPPIEEEKSSEVIDYVMTDIPPYSDNLASAIRRFMKGGRLVAILMTSRKSVHYDEGPAVYTSRKSHLDDWKAVFPDFAVVGYRLDVPRDSYSHFTQKLNGYGPWAWNDESKSFEETGQQLIYKEWDEKTVKASLKKGVIPLVDDEVESPSDRDNGPEAIRRREEGKQLLAIYTPGNTHGTLSFVFPETNALASAFTVPIEDLGSVNDGHAAGPSMDTRGYITTSTNIKKQMESARNLVLNYADRFGVVLPARADPFFLDEVSTSERKNILLSIIEQYDLIGEKYSNAGKEEDESDDEDEE